MMSSASLFAVSRSATAFGFTLRALMQLASRCHTRFLNMASTAGGYFLLVAPQPFSSLLGESSGRARAPWARWCEALCVETVETHGAGVQRFRVQSRLGNNTLDQKLLAQAGV